MTAEEQRLRVMIGDLVIQIAKLAARIDVLTAEHAAVATPATDAAEPDK
jgi:hypothetical protein